MNTRESVTASGMIVDTPSHSATFTTSDGVTLTYRDNGGPGEPIVMLPGLGQSQQAFHHQFDGWQAHRRVITLDFRAHGLSETPSHGYRIARFAADVRELLDHLGLDRVDALGWSMGASVWWSFIDLLGTQRIHRLIVVDQPTAIARFGWMSPEEIVGAGALWDLATIEQIVLGSLDPNAPQPTVESLAWTYQGDIDAEVLKHLVADMRMASSVEVGRVLFDHCMQDWRDVLPRIDVPTLVIGAEGSHVSTDSQRQTAAVIPNAISHIFPAEIASSHFPFLQNPQAFDEVVEGFLSGSSAVPAEVTQSV